MNDRPKTVYLIPEGYREAPRLLTPQELEALLEHYPDTGWEPKLAPLKHLLRCDWIERASLPGLGDLWVDEEGKLNGSVVNPVASVLYFSALGFPDLVVGRGVLIIEPSLEPSKIEQMVRDAWERVSEYRKVVEASLN